MNHSESEELQVIGDKLYIEVIVGSRNGLSWLHGNDHKTATIFSDLEQQ